MLLVPTDVRVPAELVQLLLAVSSLDGLSRHRVEGYGYVAFPRQPGAHELLVATWRPICSLRSHLQVKHPRGRTLVRTSFWPFVHEVGMCLQSSCVTQACGLLSYLSPQSKHDIEHKSNVCLRKSQLFILPLTLVPPASPDLYFSISTSKTPGSLDSDSRKRTTS